MVSLKKNLFDSIGPVADTRIPPGHAKIQVHLIYDYKQDRRYKACMLAFANMTVPNLDTYYYRIISLCSMRTIVFLVELNNIDTRTDDISNSYLTVCNTEKIVSNSGP